jgi:hypothetical protein
MGCDIGPADWQLAERQREIEEQDRLANQNFKKKPLVSSYDPSFIECGFCGCMVSDTAKHREVCPTEDHFEVCRDAAGEITKIRHRS